VTEKTHHGTSFLKKEIALFLAMLFFGFVLMPIAIWLVGNAIFGEYGGAGYGDFFGILSGKIGSGDPVAWFLVLSPWIAVQIVRLGLFAWRNVGKL
jgi:hypothetical protein